MHTSNPKTQAGMSLVEVMVAVFVLAAGLLGLAALQSRSLAFAQTSLYRSIAADLAADLADRVRANRPPFFALDDSVPPVRPSVGKGLATVPDLSTCVQTDGHSGVLPVEGCPAVFRVEADMLAWDAALRAQLPNGAWAFGNNPEKVVAPGQNPVVVPDADVMAWRYTLTIRWTERDNSTGSYVTVIE